MIGQVQLLPLHTPKEIAKQKILSNKNELLHIANSKSRYTISKGFGGQGITGQKSKQHGRNVDCGINY